MQLRMLYSPKSVQVHFGYIRFLILENTDFTETLCLPTVQIHSIVAKQMLRFSADLMITFTVTEMFQLRHDEMSKALLWVHKLTEKKLKWTDFLIGTLMDNYMPVDGVVQVQEWWLFGMWTWAACLALWFCFCLIPSESNTSCNFFFFSKPLPSSDSSGWAKSKHKVHLWPPVILHIHVGLVREPRGACNLMLGFATVGTVLLQNPGSSLLWF